MTVTKGGGRENQRRHERERKRLKVQYGPGDLAHGGYTQDISEGGIFIQAQVIYPPRTVLALRIEFPEGPWSTRGVVRWSKDLPPALKRTLRSGMGVEFLSDAAHPATTAAAPPKSRSVPPAAPTSPPPEVSDRELGGGMTHRRQVSTLGGNTFEILETDYRGAHYVRIFQLPLTDGSSEAAFKGAFWSREAAQTAVKEFLKGR